MKGRRLSMLLSIMASAGVVGTAIMTAKATPVAMERIRKESRRNHDGDSNAYTKKEAVAAAWKCYIPAAAIGSATIFCIIGANVLSVRQQASLASAYILLQNSYDDYRKTVKEMYGEETHNAIVNSIMAEESKDVHITAPGFVYNSSLDFGTGMEPEITRTFYDSFSKRYFESTIEKVIQAEYHLNRTFMLSGHIMLNDYYEFLGLEKTDAGETLGWGIGDDEVYWIDFNHRRMTLDDGMEIFIIDMLFEPYPNWEDL